MRQKSIAKGLILIIVSGLAITSCSQTNSTPTSSTPTPSPETRPETSASSSSLTITSSDRVIFLQCPSAKKECDRLAKMKDEPGGQVCSQVYGGPQTATIKGLLNKKPVDIKLSLSDGCKISQWEKWQWLVPIPK